MKKIFLVAILAIYSFATVVINNPSVKTIVVKVSNRSVNRIVLPFKILDVVYSEEKGIKIKVNGNQAFLKYIPIKKEKYEQIGANQQKLVGEPKIIYNKAKPAEAFFVTEGKTYSFAFIPRSIKSQTIIVNDFKKDTKKILNYETEDDYISTLSKISKQVCLGQIPLGYTVKNINNIKYPDVIVPRYFIK